MSSSSRKRLVVFAGPSASRKLLRTVGDFDWRPPARQGDVWKALRKPPTALLLIDGVFELEPSVWHREFIAAMEEGVAVFGAASMGALRAAELGALGMVGVGQIYRWYASGRLVDDSDVALLHADAEHDFRALTVPLVNVLHAAERAKAGGALTAREANALVQVAREIFYQERQWPRILDRLGNKWSARTLLRWKEFTRAGLEDLKQMDALEGMRVANQYVESSNLRLVPLRRQQPFRPSALVRKNRGETKKVLPSRTLLLAAWAKQMGLEAGPVTNPREEDLVLEAQLLKMAERWVPDGPSTPVETGRENADVLRLERGRRIN